MASAVGVSLKKIWKSIVILILAVWMLVILLDRFFIRGYRTADWERSCMTLQAIFAEKILSVGQLPCRGIQEAAGENGKSVFASNRDFPAGNMAAVLPGLLCALFPMTRKTIKLII